MATASDPATATPAAYAPNRLRLDGAQVAYLEAGPPDAEPVVLLHGYPANHRSWRHQIPALAAGHRVLAPDLLGWGESDRPLELRFDYETEIERLGQMLDGLGVGRCNLAGHDYGGFLALGFAQSHPHRVRRLALLNTRAHGTFVPRWYATFGLTSLVGRIPGLRSLAARLPHAEVNRRGMSSLVRSRVIDPELLESYVGWMEEVHGRRWLLHFFADYRVAARPELRLRLGEVNCPTAVIWGRRDPYLPQETAEELAREIPDAELTMVDEAGHFVMEESPARVARALQGWLER